MKNLLILIVLLSFVSCTNDSEPVVTIYISAEQSELYSHVTFENREVKFTKLDEFGKYEDLVGDYGPLNLETEVEFDLDEPKSTFIYERSKPEGNYAGLWLGLTNMNVTKKDGTDFRAFNEPHPVQASFEFPFVLESNKNYRVDCLINIDESIDIDTIEPINQYVRYNLYPELTYEITEI